MAVPYESRWRRACTPCEAMRVPALALGVLLMLATTSAFAAPGDRFEIHGTVLWPAQLINEPFLVLRGDDGRVYSMDVAAARRTISVAVRAGDRLGVIVIEGAVPYSLTAAAIVPETAAQPGGVAQPGGLTQPGGLAPPGVEATQPSASPPGMSDRGLPPPIPPQASQPPASPPQALLPQPALPPASSPPASPAREVLRLDGTVADISAGRMQLRTSEGRQVRIDLNRVRGAVSNGLRVGEQVTVFAERVDEDAFVAVGLVYPKGGR